MKKTVLDRRLTLLLGLLAMIGLAVAEAGETKVFPSYRLTAIGSDGQFHEVVGLDGRKPLIMIEGRVVHGSENWLAGRPVTGVSDNSIKVVSMEEVEAPESLALNVTVQSNVPLEGAFAVVSWIRAEDGKTAFRESPMPDLTGERQSFRLNFWRKGIPEAGWKLHFYHAGQEIYDPARTDLADATPMQSFVLHLSRHLTNSAGGDSPLAPYFMPVEQPPDALLPADQEVFTVKVKITVEPNGFISSHEFVGPVDVDLARYVSSSVEKWIFYPQIKAGKPVARSVIVPLKFRKTGSG